MSANTFIRTTRELRSYVRIKHSLAIRLGRLHAILRLVALRIEYHLSKRDENLTTQQANSLEVFLYLCLLQSPADFINAPINT